MGFACGSTHPTRCFPAVSRHLWRVVVHEHVSLPFDPRSGQVSFITDPDREASG
jgi:hypothetical protein